MSKTVTITLEAELDWDENDLWPDDDAPDNWGPKDVVSLIEDCGGVRNVIHDWGMLDGLTLSINVFDSDGLGVSGALWETMYA